MVHFSIFSIPFMFCVYFCISSSSKDQLQFQWKIPDFRLLIHHTLLAADISIYVFLLSVYIRTSLLIFPSAYSTQLNANSICDIRLTSRYSENYSPFRKFIKIDNRFLQSCRNFCFLVSDNLQNLTDVKLFC